MMGWGLGMGFFVVVLCIVGGWVANGATDMPEPSGSLI